MTTAAADKITCGFDAIGGFIAVRGDVGCYAYPTSPAADRAMIDPAAAAAWMLEGDCAFACCHDSERADRLLAKITTHVMFLGIDGATFDHLEAWISGFPADEHADMRRTIDLAWSALDGDMGDRSWPDMLAIGRRLI